MIGEKVVMINRGKKLKEFMTDEEYEVLKKGAEQYSDMPLPVWHLEIIEKCLYDLSNFDLIRCIRQDIHINLATFEIIERIDENNTPFYADIDSIELMEKLSSIKSETLLVHTEKLNRMIENIEKNNLIDLADVWMFEEQKDAYRNYINIIKSKIR